MSQQAGSKTNTNKKKARSPGRIIWTLFKFALLVCIGMGIAGAAWGAKFAYDAYQNLPTFGTFDLSQTSVIYDRNGKELHKLQAQENRTVVDFKEIPQVLLDAIVAVEDYRFYEHHGVDIWRIGGAVVNNARAVLHLGGSRGLQGASTITQQLARNSWLSQKQTLERKVQEAEIAIQIERKFTKHEILTMYLNQSYFGHGAYGIEAAAQTFFGKAAKDLTLPEAALLAGMVQSPSGYDPFVEGNREDAIKRRNIVLGEMLKHGYINQTAYEDAKASALKLYTGPATKPEDNKNPYDFTGASFVDYVVRMLTEPEVAKKFGITSIDETELLRSGWKIYTTLDPETQKVLDKAIDEQMDAADNNKTYLPVMKQNYPDLSVRPEAAGVVMDPKNGEVLAITGARRHDEGMRVLNRATDTYRQPGSAIKPLVAYGPAIQELGWGPNTIIDDTPPHILDGELWPLDYEVIQNTGRYAGLVTLGYALGDSRNAPAVRTIEAVGIDKARRYGQDFGLSSLDSDAQAALALGGLTKGVTVLDMTTAYATIANMGMRNDPTIITKIVDADGQVIFQASPDRKQVLRPTADYLLIEAMKNTITWGTGAGYTGGRSFPYPAAGKTGTTEIGQDAWFMGFTPNRVIGIWTGYDQQKHLPWTGAFVPVQIWNQAMRDLMAKTGKPQDWQKPQGIVSVEVCARTGLLPTAICPQKTTGLWELGKEPTKKDDILVSAQVVPVPLKDQSGKAVMYGGKPVTQWVLWQPGCGQPQTRLFIKRPTTYKRSPKDPWSLKYLPEDFEDELPTTRCTPTPGGFDNGGGSGGTGGTGGGAPNTGGVFPPGFIPPILGPDPSGGTDPTGGTVPGGGTPGNTGGTPGNTGGTPGNTGGTPGNTGGTPGGTSGGRR